MGDHERVQLQVLFARVLVEREYSCGSKSKLEKRVGLTLDLFFHPIAQARREIPRVD